MVISGDGCHLSKSCFSCSRPVCIHDVNDGNIPKPTPDEVRTWRIQNNQCPRCGKPYIPVNGRAQCCAKKKSIPTSRAIPHPAISNQCNYPRCKAGPGEPCHSDLVVYPVSQVHRVREKMALK